MKELLPIGSVVLLNNGQKKLMIFGRKQIQVATGNAWDYIACLYPEGNISADLNYMFNHEDIKEVFFTGYVDEEEIKFQEILQEISAEKTPASSADRLNSFFGIEDL